MCALLSPENLQAGAVKGLIYSWCYFIHMCVCVCVCEGGRDRSWTVLAWLIHIVKIPVPSNIFQCKPIFFVAHVVWLTNYWHIIDILLTHYWHIIDTLSGSKSYLAHRVKSHHHHGFESNLVGCCLFLRGLVVDLLSRMEIIYIFVVSVWLKLKWCSKGSKERYLIGQKRSLQILGEIPFVKPQADT